VFRADRPALADGAAATELGAPPPADRLNVEAPERVLALHRAYLEAGATILRTNTFNAKPGMADWRRVLREGARLAREAAAGRAAVLGSIGPGEGAGAAAAVLLEEGCEAVVLETFTDPRALAGAVADARAAGAGVVVALWTVLDPGAELSGGLGLVEAAGAGAVGVNCMPPREAGPVLGRLRKLTGLPLWAFPSAGKPGALLSPSAFAAQAAALEGVTVRGGCCGAGPAHVRALAGS
jgi:methionine synthase I (cobalamin-dependent)